VGLAAPGSGQLRDVELRTDKLQLRLIDELAWLDADAGPAPRLYESEAEGAVVHKRPLFALRGSRAGERRI
jgi:hypothetical protein